MLKLCIYFYFKNVYPTQSKTSCSFESGGGWADGVERNRFSIIQSLFYAPGCLSKECTLSRLHAKTPSRLKNLWLRLTHASSNWISKIWNHPEWQNYSSIYVQAAKHSSHTTAFSCFPSSCSFFPSCCFIIFKKSTEIAVSFQGVNCDTTVSTWSSGVDWVVRVQSPYSPATAAFIHLLSPPFLKNETEKVSQYLSSESVKLANFISFNTLLRDLLQRLGIRPSWLSPYLQISYAW